MTFQFTVSLLISFLSLAILYRIFMFQRYDMELASSPVGGKSLNITPDRPRALIIDGPALITAMADNSLRAALLEFSVRCKAVVACRVSPDQKRALVHMVKKGKLYSFYLMLQYLHIHLFYFIFMV